MFEINTSSCPCIVYIVGPTQSTDHERSGISSDVGEAFGVGVLVGAAVGVALVYVFYRYKKQRSELRRLRAGTCSETDVGID